MTSVLDEAPPPLFGWVPIAEISVGTYQRALNETQLSKMLAEYDPKQMTAILVSVRDDGYHVIDGHHRVMGCQVIP